MPRRADSDRDDDRGKQDSRPANFSQQEEDTLAPLRNPASSAEPGSVSGHFDRNHLRTGRRAGGVAHKPFHSAPAEQYQVPPDVGERTSAAWDADQRG